MHEIDVRFLFTYLFIYKLCQEAWITHRASSTTWSRKKKHFNTTNKNDNTLETTKKETEMQKQNWG